MVLWVFLLLIAQFLAGMAANLWVQIPAHHPGVSGNYFVGTVRGVTWALRHGALLLQLHVLLGTVLGVLSVVLLIRALGRRRPYGFWWPLLGWVGVFGAGANGASFLNYGHDFSSMLMSVGFALALLSYGMLLRRSPRPDRAPA